MQQRHRFLALIAVLVSGGCGGTEQEGVAARDLTSGEIETFPSEKEIPPGYAVCSDAICQVPAGTPCEALGQAVCGEQPGCRLLPVWCTGESPPEPSSGAAEPTAAEEFCEYICISDELLCEELRDAESCQGRSDCAWSELCPACATPDGSACTCQPSCVPSAPPLCEQLDQASCLGRPDCEWNSECPPCPAGSDGSSDPSCECAAICLPAGVAPPEGGWDYEKATDQPEPESPCQRTGCSGELCSAVPLSSSCEWQERYLCYDFAVCGMLVDGSCGWIPTEESTACLNRS